METAQELQTLLDGIAPVVIVSRTPLDGAFLLISLDPKDTWANGILENSRYVRMSVTPNQKIGLPVSELVIEHFSGSFTMIRNDKNLKFRKCKAKNLDEVADRIKKYVAKFPAYESIRAEVDAVGGMNAYQTRERQAAGEFLPWEKR